MSGVQSIERAFSILRVLALGPARITDVADRTDLPKSTVSRLLTALEHEGVVEQSEPGGDYVLGEALHTLAGSVAPRASLGAIIRPFLEDLARSTGGSAGFTVREGRSVYWVDNVDAVDDAMVQLSDQTGQTFPMHTVPTGVALLATLSPAELDAHLAVPLERAHDSTITDPRALRRFLAGVGDDRVVVSNEDLDPGVNAVAAPFRGSTGAWIGAVYVQGPSFRFPAPGDTERVRELVGAAVVAISERLSAN